MRAALLVLGLLGLPAFAGGPALPSGWRSPTAEELQDAWRNDCPNRCAWAAADFNGDKRVEGAFLAIHEKRKVIGLLAFVYFAPGRERWFVLDEIKRPSYVAAIGVRSYSPGTYRIVCTEDERNCGPDGKRPLKLTLPSISYFKSESASSIFYWSESSGRYVRVWESD